MIDQLEDFLLNFTTVIPDKEGQGPHRILCLTLYRHYLAHCQRYALEMADKHIFAEVADEMMGMRPRRRKVTATTFDYYYDDVLFVGTPQLLSITPEVTELLLELSAIEGYLGEAEAIALYNPPAQRENE